MFFAELDETFLEEIKQFLPASASTTKAKLWPFVEAAERKYILPILGRASYDDLQGFKNNRDQWTSGSGDDVTKTEELLRLVQLSEINLAFFIGFDIINAIISDQGFQRTETESVKGLYKYQEENVRNYFRDNGLNGLDDVLQYLEENIEYFPEWEDSDAYTIRKTSFIKDTKTFSDICDIGRSRLIFLRLQPFIQQILDLDMKPLLGKTVWNKLNEELAKEKPLSVYTLLALEIRKPLAYLSAALLVKNTGTLTEKGLYFEAKNSIFPDNTTSIPASQSSADNRYEYYRSVGEQYLEGLRQYLKDNSIPGYAGISQNIYSRDNDGKKTFFT